MRRRTNVGSKVVLQTKLEDENAQPKFKRMYIRYNAQKLGFLGGCRPFFGLDGCHLKGKFGGHLLYATTKDEMIIYSQWQWLWLSKRIRTSRSSSWSSLQVTLVG